MLTLHANLCKLHQPVLIVVVLQATSWPASPRWRSTGSVCWPAAAAWSSTSGTDAPKSPSSCTATHSYLRFLQRYVMSQECNSSSGVYRNLFIFLRLLYTWLVLIVHNSTILSTEQSMYQPLHDIWFKRWEICKLNWNMKTTTLIRIKRMEMLTCPQNSYVFIWRSKEYSNLCYQQSMSIQYLFWSIF